jgi:acyl carrier protein
VEVDQIFMMTADQIKQIVGDSIFKVLNHRNFEMHDGLRAPDVEGWDSLHHMLILNEIENAFGFKFKLKDLNKMKDMGSLIAIIQERAFA